MDHVYKLYFCSCIVVASFISNSVVAQVLKQEDGEFPNCQQWLSYNTSEDSSNQIYFNNVFGQFGAYPDLSLLPANKQCVWLKNNVPVGWSYNWPEIVEKTGDTKRYNVKAFPEIIYGEKGEFGGNPNKISGMDTGIPIKASQVIDNSINFDLEFSYREYFETNVARNVAIETFFHDAGQDCSNVTGENRKLEIMVWTERPPSEFTITNFAYETNVLLEEKSWNVYSRNSNYVVFEAMPAFSGNGTEYKNLGSTSRVEGSYNWNEFVKYVYDNKEGLQVNFNSDWCMAGLEFGTEIWYGEGEFRVDNYQVAVSEGDLDNDGIATKVDQCASTPQTETVYFGTCNSGVADVVQADGCSISDELSACDINTAKNRGQYRSCISGVSNQLKKSGLLSGRDKGKIQQCAAKL